MGSVDLEIVRLARELGADLIAMGSWVHQGMRVIEGSIPDAVIRFAPSPLVMVPPYVVVVVAIPKCNVPWLTCDNFPSTQFVN